MIWFQPLFTPSKKDFFLIGPIRNRFKRIFESIEYAFSGDGEIEMAPSTRPKRYNRPVGKPGRRTVLDQFLADHPHATRAELEAFATGRQIRRLNWEKFALPVGLSAKKKSGIHALSKNLSENQRLRDAITVFVDYQARLKRLSRPFVKFGMSFSECYDACLDATVNSAERYDPQEGRTLKNWIILNWSTALRNALRTHKRQQERENLSETVELTRRRGVHSLFSQLAIVEQRDLVRRLPSVLGRLTERERDVLTRRYGLKDGDPQELGEIGTAFGVTKERIRQIEAAALLKLRQYLNN